jgi:hypothetical protein
MHFISKFITNENLLEETVSRRNISKNSSLKLEINQDTNAREIHLKNVEMILQTNSTAFYTDAVYDLKRKILTASCVLYHDFRTAYKT